MEKNRESRSVDVSNSKMVFEIINGGHMTQRKKKRTLGPALLVRVAVQVLHIVKDTALVAFAFAFASGCEYKYP